MTAFYRRYEDAAGANSYLQAHLAKARKILPTLRLALMKSEEVNPSQFTQIDAWEKQLFELDRRLNGSPTIKQPGEKTPPTVGERLFAVLRGISNSTYGPTSMHQTQLSIVESQVESGRSELEKVEKSIQEIIDSLNSQGVWIE